MSQSSSSTASFGTWSTSGRPPTRSCSRIQRTALATSIPDASTIPSSSSVTATTLAPAASSIRARIEPTRPNPWMATRAPASSIPSRSAIRCTTRIAPRLVASRRPRVPPIESGLPMTEPGIVCPCCIE